MSVVDVFVGNYTVVDWELYALWVEGLTVTEAIQMLREQGVLSQPGVPFDLLVSDLHNHYRLFSMWEQLLHNPAMFGDQLTFQLDHDTRDILIEKYYDLDSSVMRELLGRKLSSRLRKDLDEVAEKTGVSLRSCRRQFDNVKRVYKAVEEMPGSFLQNIKTQFNLPEALARRYSVVVFVACHKFETTKKKLSHLTFDHFSLVCNSMMREWTKDGVDIDDDREPTFDRDFFSALRELRQLTTDKDKEHRYNVCQELAKLGTMGGRPLAEIEANFRNISRNILTIGQTLYHNREVKEFFVNIVEKVVDPAKQCRLTKEELATFLTVYTRVVVDGSIGLDKELRTIFERFMKILSLAILTFYL